jgi:hypothetical protein
MKSQREICLDNLSERIQSCEYELKLFDQLLNQLPDERRVKQLGLLRKKLAYTEEYRLLLMEYWNISQLPPVPP